MIDDRLEDFSSDVPPYGIDESSDDGVNVLQRLCCILYYGAQTGIVSLWIRDDNITDARIHNIYIVIDVNLVLQILQRHAMFGKQLSGSFLRHQGSNLVDVFLHTLLHVREGNCKTLLPTLRIHEVYDTCLDADSPQIELGLDLFEHRFGV